MKVINRSSVKTFPDVCGTISELYSSDYVSFTIATITGKSTPHMHKKMEEIYYILRGEGTIYIGDDSSPIKEGDLIPIPKNIFHHVLTKEGESIEVVVVTHPKFDKSDVIEVME